MSLKIRGTLQKLSLISCIIFLLSLYSVSAQTKELQRHYTKSDISIRSEGNYSKSPKVITETIFEEGGIWLRLFFDNINLGRKSTLTITSELDGSTQTFTSVNIKQWNNSTAYFNGDKITLKLTVAPGDQAVGFTIKEIGVGELDTNVKSQCGSVDDRVDSTDDAIGRIVPIGCTGWIITNGRLVTAGHCGGSRAQIIEFNVPKSNPDRTIVHPGPEDQYPISNFQSPYTTSPSQANDWAVFTAGANSQTGQTPIQAQGKSYNVVQDAPGSTITITGFGTDTGIDNQTQQTHTGPLASVNNTFVRYRTDTTGGNSGSPIIDAATGNAIGVHAYGGCSGSGGSNFGERATIPAFWQAMGLDDNPPPSDECSGNITAFPYAESFEGAIGDWAQSTGDDIDWTVNSNGTPSNGTGPDGAVDGNSYIYVEASGNGSGYPNKNAILNSPCLNFSNVSSPVLSFQYHMIGSSVGTLTIEARMDNTGNWNNVFSRTGTQGTGWNTAEIDLSNYANKASVQLRLNVVTGTSWQGDITIDDLRISNGTVDPPPTCEAIDFNSFTINAFSNQDISGDSSIVNNGTGISLQNNTWKYISVNYNVSANTVIEFDFNSTSEGEIHAIGFENDNALTSTRYFKVYGTQNYGVTNFDNYSQGSTIKYTIPVGDFYTGSMDRLVFINDNDSGTGNNSIFSNVKIYEGSCGEVIQTESTIVSTEVLIPQLGNEEEGAPEQFDLLQNPTDDLFILTTGNLSKNKTVATIYTILGKKKAEIDLKEGVNQFSARSLQLSTGMYLIRIQSVSGSTTTKKLLIQ